MPRKKGPSRLLVDARRPLALIVTNRHVELAHCGDPRACVVAQAAIDALGELFEEIQVGTNVTKIVTATKVIRYQTPWALREAIPVFDETGEWLLADGTYTLLPYKRREKENRLHTIDDSNRDRAKQSPMKNRGIRHKSRKVTRADGLAVRPEKKKR
jgi:hypothetical protein